MSCKLSTTVPIYAEGLQRALGIKGLMPNCVEPAAQMGVTMLDLTSAEFDWMRRTIRRRLAASLAGVAAQSGIVELTAQHGGIAVIDQLIFTAGAATDFRISYTPGGQVAGALLSYAADQRANRTGAADEGILVAKVGTAAVPTHSVPAEDWPVVGTTFTVVPGPFILADNILTLKISNQTLNQSMRVFVSYRERRLNPTEE